VALMRAIPGMQVVCPSDQDELVAALPAVLRSPAPTYLRFCGLPARAAHRTPFELGRAEQLRDGHQLTLATYGLLVGEVVEAAEALAGEGISARVLDLRTLVPLDEEALLRAAETPLVITVEDHLQVGGLYSLAAELFARRRVRTRLVSYGLPGRWFRPALLPDVLRIERFSAAALVARVRQTLEEGGRHA
jgi:transketolase